MSNFRKALIFITVPIVVLAIVSAVGIALEQPSYLDSAFSGVWISAVALWVIGLILCCVFAIIGERQIAAGILAGLGIGIIALGITCFANTQTGL